MPETSRTSAAPSRFWWRTRVCLCYLRLLHQRAPRHAAARRREGAQETPFVVLRRTKYSDDRPPPFPFSDIAMAPHKIIRPRLLMRSGASVRERSAGLLDPRSTLPPHSLITPPIFYTSPYPLTHSSFALRNLWKIASTSIGFTIQTSPTKLG